MEMEVINSHEVVLKHEPIIAPTAKPFIEANTITCTLDEVRNNHIIAVFIKDNEPVISHHDFIQLTIEPALEEVRIEYLGTEKYPFKWWPLYSTFSAYYVGFQVSMAL
jgi:hypothetical protein